MWISYYFVLFCLYSCMGWIFETIYCTSKTGKWENRGFLFGPLCPIYGSGAVAVTVVFQNLQEHHAGAVAWWEIYIASVLGSAVLEFATSWVLEKLFHASWWDYSYMRFNIQGRVCLRNALLFGVAGLVIYYGIMPAMTSLLAPLSAIAFEAVALIFMAVMAGDCTLTVCALTNLEQLIQQSDENLNRHMEQFVESLEEHRADLSTRISEEKQRFAKQHAERTAARLSYMNRSAWSRVVRVRGAKHERDNKHREILFEAIKKYKR